MYKLNKTSETIAAVHTLCSLKDKETKKPYKYIELKINLMYKLYMVGFLCPPKSTSRLIL